MHVIQLRRNSRRRAWTLAICLLVVLSATGCTEPADGGRQLPTVTASPSRTAAPAGEEEAVAAAYLAYWDAYLAAHDPPDENHPALRQHATGKAYDAVAESAMTMRLARRAIRLPDGAEYNHDVTVLHVGRDIAMVRDCTVDDLTVINLDTGEIVNDKVKTILGTAELSREDGRWKVTYTAILDEWEGVAGCAVE